MSVATLDMDLLFDTETVVRDMIQVLKDDWDHPIHDYTFDRPRVSRVSRPTTANSILTRYSKLGWRIFPVSSTLDNGECTCGRPDCPNKGKHPRISQWPENATTDLIQLVEWKKKWPDTNWALACGQESGVWVLDVDDKNGGYESLAKLESEIGELPKTVRVKTGGGGLHIYFAWPTDGTVITNAVNLKGDYPGLDVRGHRGYVVVPPGKHKSGNRYDWAEGLDPDSVTPAQAPQALVEVIKNAGGSRSYSDKPRDTRPWESVPDDIIRQKAAELCPRIGYFTTEAGSLDVTYEDWVSLASWAHALTDDETVFHEWSSVDKDRYRKQDTGKKWRDTADMAPRSCHRAQSDHPLLECANCPFFERDKNPSFHIRVAYGKEQGVRGPWGAPPMADHKTIEDTEKTRQTAYTERGDRHMEAQYEAFAAHAEQAAEVEQIDVTEDYEGNTATDDAGQAHAGDAGAGSGPNFRLAADNITPLVEQSRALAQKLKDGANPFDVKDEIGRVLTAIHKLDKEKCGDEMDRIVFADKDAAKKHGRSAYFNKKTLAATIQRQLEHETAELLTRQMTVGEVWPDAPEEHHELPVPIGYRYSDDGVDRFVSTAQGGFNFEEVSSQPTYVAGWREDISTGEITVVIRTRTRNRGWIEVTAQPSDFEDKRKTSELRNQGCASTDSTQLGKYLLSGYDLVRTRFGLEPELGTSRLGWHDVNDNLYFVFPEQSFGTMPIHLHTNKQQLEQDLSVRGDLEKEREALVGAMLKYPKLAFAVGTAAASILMRPAKLKGKVDMFGFCTEYVSAQTGTGKSTTVSAAIAIYGSPHSIRNFQMTQFAATQSMIVRSDLPNVWQEAQAGNQSGKGNNADPGMLLHVLGDGGGKLMGTKGGGLRNNPQIFGTMLLANNENFVNPSTAKQGELQRVFTFDPPYPPNTPAVKSDLEQMMNDLSDHHGNGGREMVHKLIELVGYSWTALKDKVQEDYEAQYQSAKKAVPADIENHSMFDRRAKIVALVRVGLKYLLELGYGMDEVVTEMLHRGIDEAFSELIKNERADSEAVETERYLTTIKDYIMSRTSQIVYMESVDQDGSIKVPPNGYIGTLTEMDDTWHVALQNKALQAVFEESKKSSRAIVREWAKQEIITKEGDRLQHQVTMRQPNGVVYNNRFYCFRLDKLGILAPDGAIERYRLDFGAKKKDAPEKGGDDI